MNPSSGCNLKRALIYNWRCQLHINVLLINSVLCNKVVGFFGTTAPPPPVGQVLLIHEVSRSHILTHHSRQDFSGRMISPSQRPLPNNTKHSQQTNIHAPAGIRTHSLSRRTAADPRLRPHGHWERQ